MLLTKGPGKARLTQPEPCPGQRHPCWNCGQWSVASHKLVPGKADSGDILEAWRKGCVLPGALRAQGVRCPPVDVRPARLSLTSRGWPCGPSTCTPAGPSGGSGGSGRALLCTREEGLGQGSRLGSVTRKTRCVSWAGAFQPARGEVCARPQEAQVPSSGKSRDLCRSLQFEGCASCLVVPPGERVPVVEAGPEHTGSHPGREGVHSCSASDREQVSPHVRSNTSHRCVCRVTDVRRVTSALQRHPACGLRHVAGLGAVCCSRGCPGRQSHGLPELLSPPVSGGRGAQAGPGSAPSPHAPMEMGRPARQGFPGARDVRDGLATLAVGQGRLGEEPPPGRGSRPR